MKIPRIRESAYAPLNPRWPNQLFSFYFEIKMTREEKLEAIYKEMANKERSIGCRINVKYRAYYHWETGGEVSYSKEDELIIWIDWVASNGEVELNESDLSKATPNWYIEDLETYIKIIWHPVMIGDVLRQIRLLAGYALDNDLIKKSDFGNVIAHHNYRITQIWEDFREPIEEQTEECVNYVYSLIQK